MNPSTGVPVGRGFWLGTDDGRFSFKGTGFVHLDWRLPIDLEDGRDAGFPLVRRARMAFEGNVFGQLEYRALLDAAGGLMPVDLYLDWRAMPELNLRVGKFKSPFGFERRMRAYAILFIERGFPTSLAPNRDTGVFIHGQTRDGFFSYDLAVLGGASDLESLDGLRGSPELAGRLYLQPFRLFDVPALRHLGLGISATAGVERGSAGDPRLGSVRTTGRRAIFGYANAAPDGATYADGARDRLSLHAHWRHGRYLALAEYTRSSQRVRLGAETRRLTHQAWQAVFSLMLSDDEHGFFGVKPARPLDPKKGHAGAVSLSGRVQGIHFDAMARPFARQDANARRATSGTLSVQWHLNKLLEIQADIDLTLWDLVNADAARTQAGELSFGVRLEARY